MCGWCSQAEETEMACFEICLRQALPTLGGQGGTFAGARGGGEECVLKGEGGRAKLFAQWREQACAVVSSLKVRRESKLIDLKCFVFVVRGEVAIAECDEEGSHDRKVKGK